MPIEAVIVNKKRSLIMRYGVGLLSFLLILFLVLTFQRYHIKIDLLLVLIAALVGSTWYGGRGPGLMVAALFEVATIILVGVPHQSFRVLFAEFNGLGLLVFLVLLVSARKNAESRLREQREWLRVTLSSIGEAVIATDLNGVVNFMNPMAEAMTGWTISEVTNQPLETIFRPLSPNKETNEMIPLPGGSKSIRQGLAVGLNDNATLLARNGDRRSIEFSRDPIRSQTGVVTGAVVAFRDVSARKEAEDRIHRLNEELEHRVIKRTAELEAANKELEAFSYSVSHDLRAPLRAMDGFSRILLEDYGPQLADEAREYLEIIRTNAQKMGHLVDDLLAFSRLGRQPLVKRAVEPDELVHNALEDLAAEQQGRQIEIRVNRLPECQADPSLLKQVFVNLLSNSLKYTRRRDKAVIEIGALSKGNGNGSSHDTYFVKDNGVGFDMQYSGKLFGVFQRLHRAEDYEGTGVGLAIVQRVVQRHGGQVWAEAGVDLGATFYFTLAGGKADE